MLQDALRKTARRLDTLEEGRATEAPGIVQTWTPELWQNGVQLAITVDFAVYTTIGQLVIASARFTVNAAGAVGLVEVRGLPYPSAYSSIGGEGVIFTGGVNRVGAVRQTALSSNVVITLDNQSSDFGTAPAVALAIGNGIRIDATYFKQL